MVFRRVQMLMMLLALSGGFASGQAAANDDSDDVSHVSAFFPEVKPFVPAAITSTPYVSAALKSPKRSG
jgi:hypothetical protein